MYKIVIDYIKIFTPKMFLRTPKDVVAYPRGVSAPPLF
jgi:hypothetical protein